MAGAYFISSDFAGILTNSMRQLKNRLHIAAKRLRYRVASKAISTKFLHTNVPYFSQWESPALAERFFNDKMAAVNDPNWKNSGANTPEEYADWSWNGCGMASLKMILTATTGKTIPLVRLGKLCARYGGYTLPLQESKGLRYAPFAKFVRAEFDLRAAVKTVMLSRDIMHELSRGNFVIASVSMLSSPPKPVAGGHLVVILGYDLVKQEFYLHDSAGFTPETQECVAVSFKDFDDYFARRGIVIQPKGAK